VIAFTGCVKDKEWYINTHSYNATLKINAYLASDTSLEKIPLQYMIISLYESEYDRKMHQNSAATTQTDAKGYAILQHLNQSYYYARTWHYLYGEKLVSVSTQDGQETQMEVAY